MKCPHCLISFHETWKARTLDIDGTGDHWQVVSCQCSSCNKMIIGIVATDAWYPNYETMKDHAKKPVRIIQPKGSARAPLGKEVPDRFSNDYLEACVVLPDSPKASAALSRRCLQNLLREHAKVKQSNLSDEISDVMGKLPSHLANAIDAVRHIGNFAAHPMKSTNTGEIIDVEAGRLNGYSMFSKACLISTSFNLQCWNRKGRL